MKGEQGMHRVNTSFKNFIMLVRKPVQHKQNILIKSNILLRGNTRKCLICGGVKKILFGSGKVVNGFYPIAIPYLHKDNCSQRGKW